MRRFGPRKHCVQTLTSSGNPERRQAAQTAQTARRAVVESPVVYHADVEPAVANHLRGTPLATDLARLTGLRVERRAEGVLLMGTVGFTGERFPGTGSVAQAAVPLAVEMADRIADPDGRRVERLAPPDKNSQQQAMVGQIDAGLPTATVLLDDTGTAQPDLVDGGAGVNGADDGGRLPFITDSFPRTAVGEILRRYRSAFGAKWHADPERLRTEAVALLERFGAVTGVPGGVLVLPLMGRYRNTVAAVRQRAATETLF